MTNITSISWYAFLIGIIILTSLWLFSSKTKVGRSAINSYSPWSLNQWKRVLLVLGSTLFILVNPIFHLVTAVVVIVLYYLFVGQNLQSIKTVTKIDSPDKLHLFEQTKSSFDKGHSFVCKRNESVNMVADNKAINRCLFSFPFIVPKTRPRIRFLEGEYHIDLKLTDENFISSLYTYLKRAGFSITNKISH